MRQLLSFLSLLVASKFHSYKSPVSGIEELDVTSSGECIITRQLQVGNMTEEEFYFPEYGKLIRITERGVYTFQEQAEGH